MLYSYKDRKLFTHFKSKKITTDKVSVVPYCLAETGWLHMALLLLMYFLFFGFAAVTDTTQQASFGGGINLGNIHLFITWGQY